MGCTPIDNPGPRWSAYVFNLKHEQGLLVETVHEAHKGHFPGTHARYILRSQLEIVSRSDEQDRDCSTTSAIASGRPVGNAYQGE